MEIDRLCDETEDTNAVQFAFRFGPVLKVEGFAYDGMSRPIGHDQFSKVKEDQFEIYHSTAHPKLFASDDINQVHTF